MGDQVEQLAPLYQVLHRLDQALVQQRKETMVAEKAPSWSWIARQRTQDIRVQRHALHVDLVAGNSKQHHLRGRQQLGTQAALLRRQLVEQMFAAWDDAG